MSQSSKETALPRADARKLFAVYRAYAKHQYELINHRTNWYLAAQGVLIAAFALSLQKKIDIVANCKMESTSVVWRPWVGPVAQVDIFLIILCCVGFSLTLVFRGVLKAASEPVSDAYQHWEKAKPAFGPDDPYVRFLPNLTGFRLEKYRSRGRDLITKWLSIINLLAWIGCISIPVLDWIQQGVCLGK